MSTQHHAAMDSDSLVRALLDPAAYHEPCEGGVRLLETHISWVFLTDRHAYKVKKPIRNDYLDYATADRRAHFCREELRLNRRFAPELYIDVVPIVRDGETFRVGGAGEPYDFAVKMHRFPDDALLSQQVKRNGLGPEGVAELARIVAQFHFHACQNMPPDAGRPETVFELAAGNFPELRRAAIPGTHSVLSNLEDWTRDFCRQHQPLFVRRRENGYVRECHGDLHLDNMLHWRGRWMPFDGIEFNRDLRWIDVLSDAAFLVMDFAARGHLEWSRDFVSQYLEQTVDYASLELLRFYTVYRALVRAKVLATRAGQDDVSQGQRERLIADCVDHLELARETASPPEPSLWITHGFSGAGKSSGCQEVVERRGAIRLRSDVVRKRIHGFRTDHRPSGSETGWLYAESATKKTYDRLRQLAGQVLRAGYPAIVDATFLKADLRRQFADFAREQGVPFHILDFPAEEETLRRRVAERVASGNDVSDAGIEVLERQLRTAEPLTEAEREKAITMPAVVSAIESLSADTGG